MNRFVCIHGHFYQPPRESPWLEAIEIQDSAFPYHDWNEWVTAECYAANAVSRIRDTEGRIAQLVAHCSRTSANAARSMPIPPPGRTTAVFRSEAHGW